MKLLFALSFVLFSSLAQSEISRSVKKRLEKSIVMIEQLGIGGTGSLIDSNKILTAYHVVENFESVNVTFNRGKDNETQKARVVVVDAEADIAILKLEKPVRGPYLKVGILETNFAERIPIAMIGYPQKKLNLLYGDIFDMRNSIDMQLKNQNFYALTIQMRAIEGASGAPIILPGTDRLVGVVNNVDSWIDMTTAVVVDHIKLLVSMEKYLEANHKNYGKTIMSVKTFPDVHEQLLEKRSPPVLTDVAIELQKEESTRFKAFLLFHEASELGYTRAKAELMFYYKDGVEFKELKEEVLKKADLQTLERVASRFYLVNKEKQSLQFLREASNTGYLFSKLHEFIFYDKGIVGDLNSDRARRLVSDFTEQIDIVRELRKIKGEGFPGGFLEIYGALDMAYELGKDQELKKFLNNMRNRILKFDFYTSEQLDEAKKRVNKDQIQEALEKACYSVISL